MNALLALALAVAPAFSQWTTSGDATVTGAMGAGTVVPRAALEVGLQSSDSYALEVSSGDGAALFLLDRSAKAGLGVTPGGARLDLSGRADAGEVALELRAGNSSSSVTSAQIAFADATGGRRHSLRSRATGTQRAGNSIDFYLWTSSDSTYGLGSFPALSLQASTASGVAGVHAIPSTVPVTTELVVSSGTTYAGGVILRAQSIGPPCFGALKSDLRRLGDEERAQAVADIMALRPVKFRYKGNAVKRMGYIFEEAPQSVRGSGGTIAFDERLMNLELALQAVRKRAESLEAELARLEGR